MSTGLSTKSSFSARYMCTLSRPAVMRRFPDRTTSIGSLINSYLGCHSELEDHVVHLLFSANRSVLAITGFLYCTPVLCQQVGAAEGDHRDTGGRNQRLYRQVRVQRSGLLCSKGKKSVGRWLSSSSDILQPGLSIDWCKQPDVGLPAPDLVCFLDVSEEVAVWQSREPTSGVSDTR